MGSLAMMCGQWKKCRDLIMSLKSWLTLYNKASVLSMLEDKIKESALRTWLFTYSGVYSTISLAKLAEVFELPPAKVHSYVSKMIIASDLQASHDQPTQTIEIHKEESSLLQTL